MHICEMLSSLQIRDITKKFQPKKKNYISIIESHQDRKYLSKSENDISSSIELHEQSRRRRHRE
ncbi:hypothetical protein BLOT_014405 [Blomia tropicalis]|nr:hypothetical protein BLOT_014405 [Blomia tropicalis]